MKDSNYIPNVTAGWSRWLILPMLAILAFVPKATAAVLSYDSFSGYTAGNLPAQTYQGPGYVSGGSWSSALANGSTVTTSGGLSYSTLRVSGGKVTVKGDGTDTWGKLDKAGVFSAAGLYDSSSLTIGGGTVSGTLYVSFLMRAVSTDRNNEYGGLQLSRSNSTSSGILIGNAFSAWAYSLDNSGTSINMN